MSDYPKTVGELREMLGDCPDETHLALEMLGAWGIPLEIVGARRPPSGNMMVIDVQRKKQFKAKGC